MNSPRPLWKSVQDYVLIAMGMISYAIGWNVFLLPTNVQQGDFLVSPVLSIGQPVALCKFRILSSTPPY